MNATTTTTTTAAALDAVLAAAGPHDGARTVTEELLVASWAWNEPDTERSMEGLVELASVLGLWPGRTVGLVLAPPHDGDGPCHALVLVTLSPGGIIATDGGQSLPLGPLDPAQRDGLGLARALLVAVDAAVTLICEHAATCAQTVS